ncbi:MAG: type II toxin-antitoxin system PemK/MazF family toxin [Candidatus Electryonea clarkiae]|nr:type II toxin-antitoxin system PemK/MazF family toxin [Candidatus Electryonea clarkiae]MDP8286434.1 type II toxin-antitoxin system PemK/MazF family toxin [Candidatus Electryonea clarkiae]
MSRIERGDVVIVNLEPTSGSETRGISRPCLVVSPEELNRIFRGVIVCPITDAKHLKRSELGLTWLPEGEGGLSKDSLVVAFQIRMIDKRRITHKTGIIDDKYLEEVEESLKAVLDIN